MTLKNRKSLAMHLIKRHKEIKGLEEYTLKFILGNVHLCKCGCGQETKWHKTLCKFNDYITGHNHLFTTENQPVRTKEQSEKCAMQEGGRGELSSPNGKDAVMTVMVKPITAKEKIPKTTNRSWENLYAEWRTFIRKQHGETFTKDGTQFSDCGKWAYRLIDIRKSTDRAELSNLYTALGNIGCRLTVYTSDEWREKGDICRQQIGHILGGSTVRIGARQCQIRQLTTAERRDVFTKYHIQGDTSAKVAYGLTYGGEIVGAVSGRVPV